MKKRDFVLDEAAIARGLQVMSKKYPMAFNREFPIDPDNYGGDACDSDLFVQCCLFGEETFS